MIRLKKGFTIETFFLYTLGIVVGVFLIYLFGVLMAPYAPSEIKNTHFECGLPPSSSNPKKANFGFFMFAIMFIVADMTGLFLTLFVFTDNPQAQLKGAVFALIVSCVIAIAMKEYNRVEDI